MVRRPRQKAEAEHYGQRRGRPWGQLAAMLWRKKEMSMTVPTTAAVRTLKG